MRSIAPAPNLPPPAEPAGRPGDWWEPVPVCAAEVAVRVGAEAARRRLALDVLVAILLEHALVVRDVGACGLDQSAARAALAAAGDGLATIGPGRIHTSYVRMLRTGDRGYERERDARLARRDLVLPLRLHEAARTVDLPAVCRSEAVGEALAWEAAAATAGQFMREWALRTLLAARTAPQPG